MVSKLLMNLGGKEGDMVVLYPFLNRTKMMFSCLYDCTIKAKERELHSSTDSSPLQLLLFEISCHSNGQKCEKKNNLKHAKVNVVG